MKINQLIINNFMPYKGEQVINFPMHETQNVMLLFGDNMRGKTSFLNSIRWGFYGVALARHLRKIPRANLINSEAIKENDWNMSISVSFTNDGKEYHIERKIKKYENVISPNSDKDFKEMIGMKINGIPIIADNYNYEINQVIPEEISRFFLFDGELLQEYESLLIDESDQGKKIKNHIEQVLGVPALIHARDELDILLKEARTLQNKDARNNKKLKDLAENQKRLENELRILEEDRYEQKKQLTSEQKEIDLIDDFLRSTEALQKAKIKMERLKQKKNDTESNINKLKESNNQLLRNLWKDVLKSSIALILNNLKEKKKGLSENSKSKLEIEIKISQLEDSLSQSNVCNICEQEISMEHRLKLNKKLQALKSKVKNFGDINSDTGDLDSRIYNLSDINSEGESKRLITNLENITEFNIQSTKIDSDLEEINNEIRGQDTNEIMRKREKRSHYEKALHRVEITLEKLDKKIEENNKKQEKLSDLILKSDETKGMLSSRRVEIYQNLKKIFEDGIGKLRDEIRKEVASFATDTFKKLTTEPEYKCLEINSSYGLSIVDHNNEVIKERSAGAEQIVALSLIDGLNRTARKSGPIIMDTPLGRLDPMHRDNVLKFLPDMGEQIILLVHEGEINPNEDIKEIASRIGIRYQINRVSAKQSIIERKI